ncbi:pyridoxal 5'-phosphate synthase glutaminase subunit PdxT [Raineyella sp. LH-20]|uniref:pyridoxal 5'-phosphate synthase glutaminase subunit PdxT n=1 Tax=Raineyella sp. LH-20 TaxID=3081204 RepID=UPI0029544771|nr:pyridoxal 5'-phosphate synthase glutaminase subunit PdxT [Raineyella sp. LH-20]WOP17754.1 pyridoxal 5'-phosphate synthase glutaminase subunit PdxT [Raineyella sp. LH-20]
MTTIGVVALQGAVSEHVTMLTALGAQTREIRTPDQLDGVDGVVLPGGESTAMARAAAKVGLFEELAVRRAAGLPIFGTCAGLILLAERVKDGQALTGFATVGGLDITARRNAYGGQLASFTADLPIEGLAGPAFPAVFIRAPQVVEVGPDVEVLARTGADGPVVAVRHGRLLATSFHPELTADDRLHRRFLELVEAA